MAASGKGPHAAHVGMLFLDPEHPLFAEHQPGNPCVPASLLCEAMLRTARQAVEAVDRRAVDRRAVDRPAGSAGTVEAVALPVLENMRFRRFVRPGHAECRAVIREDHVACEIWADGKLACEGKVRWTH